VSVAAFHEVAQVLLGNLVADIELGDLVGKLVEALVFPRLVLLANIRHKVRHKQTAVWCETLKDGLLEGHVEESAPCTTKKHSVAVLLG
jgi:hypothetical protein